MVAISDTDEENLFVVVYIDSIHVFCGKTFNAVLLLLAVYYVFQAEWPANDKLPMLLLSALMASEKLREQIAKYPTVLSILEAINMQEP